LRRHIVVSAGVIALTVALGPVSAASGAARAHTAQRAKTSGPEKIFVLPQGETSATHPGTILMTGTIADYGKTIATNAKRKPTASGLYRQLELKKGTILVDISALGRAITKAFSHPTFDAATCSVSVTVSAKVSLVSGKGGYTGITGSFTLSGSIAEIAPRTKSGACTTKTSTPPLATFSEFTGSGTVTLP
jgi:hypothetical protein